MESPSILPEQSADPSPGQDAAEGGGTAGEGGSAHT